MKIRIKGLSKSLAKVLADLFHGSETKGEVLYDVSLIDETIQIQSLATVVMISNAEHRYYITRDEFVTLELF